MNKDFKVGDTVKVVGHPYIKDGTLGTVRILGADNYKLEVRFGDGDIDCLIDIKYLEKVEDWLSFKVSTCYTPFWTILISYGDSFEKTKEIKLYNYMYQWKEKFDPEEPDWEEEEHKWYISKILDGNWYISHTFRVKQNLQIYFTTAEKAEQCLEWLKKEGVLY